MTTLGYQSLSIALVLSIFSAMTYTWAWLRNDSRLLNSANRATKAIFFLVTFASLALITALLSRDFQIEYVAHYSNRSLSWFYTLAAFWAGQAGSLLLWTWLLAIFAFTLLKFHQKRNFSLVPVSMVVMSVTLFFFLYLTVFKTNPFAKTPFIPADGTGLNPLLQNPAMIFHPPSLYIGFVAYTVPFALTIAALVTRNLDQQWLKSIRRWSLFSWLFLTIGNLLGMQWAYVELGWGGYWAWDPVENASLLPWLTGTAFLHSIIIQERRGMLKTWSVTLIVLTFALTIFGTFVTRSGLISSVHAFGVSNLGPIFLFFLAVILFGSLVLIIVRSDQLVSARELSSWSSKESGFLLNNLLFLILTLGVFLGTIMPALSEWITGEKMTVGEPFFNRMATPMGMAIFLLIGLCVLLAWGKTSLDRMVRNFALPLAITLFMTLFLYFQGVSQSMPLLASAIAVFSLSATFIDFVKGVLARKRARQESLLTATTNLFRQNKRRYGGYTVHLGILLLFIGIIGSSSFAIESNATLQTGQTMEIADYRLEFTGLKHRTEGALHIDAAQFAVSKNDKNLGTIEAEKHFHANFQPATEVGIRSTLKEDLYIILASIDQNSKSVTVSVLVNPLILWMWIGGFFMSIGTVIAMLPQRQS